MKIDWCKWGFHKWMYVRWPWHPFGSLPVCQFWRGCRRCHKDQAESHTPGTYILETYWDEYPVDEGLIDIYRIVLLSEGGED